MVRLTAALLCKKLHSDSRRQSRAGRPGPGLLLIGAVENRIRPIVAANHIGRNSYVLRGRPDANLRTRRRLSSAARRRPLGVHGATADVDQVLDRRSARGNDITGTVPTPARFGFDHKRFPGRIDDAGIGSELHDDGPRPRTPRRILEVETGDRAVLAGATPGPIERDGLGAVALPAVGR